MLLPATAGRGSWRGLAARQDGQGGAGMGPKIAIVGGGIGGLTAAVALARKGLAAEVYEHCLLYTSDAADE